MRSKIPIINQSYQSRYSVSLFVLFILMAWGGGDCYRTSLELFLTSRKVVYSPGVKAVGSPLCTFVHLVYPDCTL